MENQPICAGTFNNIIDAEIYRDWLQANGMEAQIIGPTSGSGYGQSFGILSRVSVMVPAHAALRLAHLTPRVGERPLIRRNPHSHTSDPPVFFHRKSNRDEH